MTRLSETSAVPHELVCFGPKPRTATLQGTRRIVWNILASAKGITWKHGMTTREIWFTIKRMRDTYALVMKMPPFDYARTMQRVRRALAYLSSIGKVERLGACGIADWQPYRWRRVK